MRYNSCSGRSALASRYSKASQPHDAYKKAAFFLYKEKRLGPQGKLAVNKRVRRVPRLHCQTSPASQRMARHT